MSASKIRNDAMREEDGRDREFASRDVEDCPRPLDKQRRPWEWRF